MLRVFILCKGLTALQCKKDGERGQRERGRKGRKGEKKGERGKKGRGGPPPALPPSPFPFSFRFSFSFFLSFFLFFFFFPFLFFFLFSWGKNKRLFIRENACSQLYNVRCRRMHCYKQIAIGGGTTLCIGIQ